MCEECYSDENRITPLLNPLDCLENHTQYICGTCGRCICIEHDPNRGLQRWNFPFKSLEIAKLYLRTADYTTKSACGIYEIENNKGRLLCWDGSIPAFKSFHSILRFWAGTLCEGTCFISGLDFVTVSLQFSYLHHVHL